MNPFHMHGLYENVSSTYLELLISNHDIFHWVWITFVITQYIKINRVYEAPMVMNVNSMNVNGLGVR
jgi:hypothetical protein